MQETLNVIFIPYCESLAIVMQLPSHQVETIAYQDDCIL
jgi:hypothetical protein